jgi:hypothetical protein
MMNIYNLVTDPLKSIYGLQSTNKAFTVLFYPSWRGNHYQAFLHQLQHDHLASTYNKKVIFKVVVSVGSDVEDYCIDHLRVMNLPVIVLYSNGSINSIIELQPLRHNSDKSNVFHEQAVSLKEFISYTNESSVDYTRIISELYNDHMDSITLHHHHLPHHHHHHNNNNNSSNSMKLFISGDRSSVGKSSICLAILATLLRKGFSPSSLAYIKPVTQCEAEQPITRFCNRNGISNRGIGPVVFYKGFTRAFLSNETHSSDVMMEEIDEAVQTISRGKLITIVDGVGYPSVGKNMRM